MRIIYLSLVLCCSSVLFSQNATLRGRVVDAQTNLPIAYVALGISGTSIGTVTDENGQFVLENSANPEVIAMDIVFTSLGYEDVVIASATFTEVEQIIKMKHKVYGLDEVVVYDFSGELMTLGKGKINTRMSVNFAIDGKVNQNLGSEIGRRFKIKDQAMLKTFKFYVSQNNFNGVKFRVNVYDARKKRSLTPINKKEVIIALTDKQKGWVAVDLSPYNIIAKENVVVAIEWIAADKGGSRLNIPINMPSLGSTHYYKYGSKNNWKVYGNMSAAMVLEVMEKE